MHRLVSFGIAALGGWLFWVSVSLGVGSLAAPGPGLWPAMICALLVVCALVSAVTEADGRDYEGFSRRTLVVVLAIASMLVYVAAFNTLGYVLPTAVMLVIWLRFIAGESWRLTAVFSIGCTATLYLIFVVFFAVPFPTGSTFVVAG